jgi:hypothetical protein
MMTDRELLEYAAKAAGYEYTRWSENIIDYDSRHYGEPALYGSHEYDSWNPLNDDGDALMLAVKLKIEICHFADGEVDASYPAGGSVEYKSQPYDGDCYAAARRAIVRAAAEIGKSMVDTRGTLPL